MLSILLLWFSIFLLKLNELGYGHPVEVRLGTCNRARETYVVVFQGCHAPVN